jgi:O-antigen/teichoic acid export membrane protein
VLSKGLLMLAPPQGSDAATASQHTGADGTAKHHTAGHGMSDLRAETAGPGAADPVSQAEDDLRLEAGPESLRRTAARGTLINAAFQVGLTGLGTFKRIAVAAFLTRAEFGTWGIILPILVTLVWVKEIGVMDKYIQNRQPDQELEWQKAFTLELFMSFLFFLVLCAVLPVYGFAYGHSEIVLPGIALASSVLISAFETPAWIPYRQMRYARQRLLISIDPVVAVFATIALGATGFGYWALVGGVLAGSFAGAVVCVATCPYPIRLRFDRERLKSYWDFSWPLLGSGISRMVVVQGALLTANRSVGLAGIGAIGLATNIATFSDRVDGIVSSTIYPAVCRVADRRDKMAEAFVKSNRIALMWAMPFAVAVALFAGDFVDFVIGERWRPAVGLMAAIALTCGLSQVAFNWGIFMRAIGRTKPLFTAAVLDLAVFLSVAVPATLAWGLTGYAIAFATTNVVQLGVRGWFMRRLFPGFKVLRQLVRGFLPVVPPALLILLVRLVAPGGRSLGRALAELALYGACAVATTYVLERRLIAELLGYLRRPPKPALSVT